LGEVIAFASLEAIAVEIPGHSHEPAEPDPRRGWFAVWARATRDSQELGPIHRFLRAQTHPPDLDGIAPQDMAYLLPMITGDALKGPPGWAAISRAAG
jgi:hypothetical protein